MIIKTFRIFVFLSLVLLQSCTIPLTARLFNNSDSMYVVHQLSSVRERKTYELKPYESVDIKFWEFDEILIFSDNVEWRYEPGMYPSGVGKIYGWGPFVKRVVKVQLETDGSLYLLSPNQDFPLVDFSDQPEGWPIEN